MVAGFVRVAAVAVVDRAVTTVDRGVDAAIVRMAIVRVVTDLTAIDLMVIDPEGIARNLKAALTNVTDKDKAADHGADIIVIGTVNVTTAIEDMDKIAGITADVEMSKDLRAGAAKAAAENAVNSAAITAVVSDTDNVTITADIDPAPEGTIALMQ